MISLLSRINIQKLCIKNLKVWKHDGQTMISSYRWCRARRRDRRQSAPDCRRTRDELSRRTRRPAGGRWRSSCRSSSSSTYSATSSGTYRRARVVRAAMAVHIIRKTMTEFDLHNMARGSELSDSKDVLLCAIVVDIEFSYIFYSSAFLPSIGRIVRPVPKVE